MIVLFVCTLVWAFVEALLDAVKINNQEYINHKSSLIARVIGIGFVSILVMDNIIESISYAITASILFWIVFDMSINYFLKRRLFQRGSSSFLDNILNLFETEYRAFYFKIAIFVISIIINTLI